MDNWRNVLLAPQETISRAIEVLNNEKPRIVLVVDEEDHLLGTVTDGDVRRALIRQCTMKTEICEIMNDNPRTVLVGKDDTYITNFMMQNSLLQVPIVDCSNQLQGLETIRNQNKLSRYDNPVFIMAGGFGKRLHPLTENTPKPLLKVGAKSILETILEQFVYYGFHNFYISTHYKAEMVREHLGNGEHWNVNIHYVYEEEPLGTAGALGLLPKDIPDLPIIMMNGDLLTSVNFGHLLSFHHEQRGLATVCVREYDFQVPFGVIERNGCFIKRIVEKPTHKFFVNAGIYVLDHSVLYLVDGKCYLDMPSLLEQSIESGSQINMFPLHEYWLDIGRIEEYEKAQIEIQGMERTLVK